MAKQERQDMQTETPTNPLKNWNRIAWNNNACASTPDIQRQRSRALKQQSPELQ